MFNFSAFSRKKLHCYDDSSRLTFTIERPCFFLFFYQFVLSDVCSPRHSHVLSIFYTLLHFFHLPFPSSLSPYSNVRATIKHKTKSPHKCQAMQCVLQLISNSWFQASAAVYMSSSLFWEFTQRRLVVCYRRFGTTYRSIFKGQAVQEDLVTNYQSTLRNIPEERRSHLYRGGSPKSRK